MNTHMFASVIPTVAACIVLFMDDLPPTPITLPPVSNEERADDEEFLFYLD